MNYSRVVLGLPGWVEEHVSAPDRQYPPEEYRMRLAIELWRHKVARDVCCDEAAAVLRRCSKSTPSAGARSTTPARANDGREDAAVRRRLDGR